MLILYVNTRCLSPRYCLKHFLLKPHVQRGSQILYDHCSSSSRPFNRQVPFGYFDLWYRSRKKFFSLSKTVDSSQKGRVVLSCKYQSKRVEDCCWDTPCCCQKNKQDVESGLHPPIYSILCVLWITNVFSGSQTCSLDHRRWSHNVQRRLRLRLHHLHFMPEDKRIWHWVASVRPAIQCFCVYLRRKKETASQLV